MSAEAEEERKRRLARERKRAQREREQEQRQRLGATEIRFEVYSGTLAALERLQVAADFEDREELLTLLIHGADALCERDPSRFSELVNLPSHANAGLERLSAAKCAPTDR